MTYTKEDLYALACEKADIHISDLYWRVNEYLEDINDNEEIDAASLATITLKACAEIEKAHSEATIESQKNEWWYIEAMKKAEL